MSTISRRSFICGSAALAAMATVPAVAATGVKTLSNGKTETKNFTDYPPETITQIIEYITPQLIGLIQTQKKYLTEKITFLRTATKQLDMLSQLKENLPKIIPVTETLENVE